MPVVRPIDRWFVEEVLPYERDLLDAAYRLCRGTDEARDLVQDVLARMLATEAWGAIVNPRTYMLRMMRNLAIDRLRRAKIVDFRHFVDFENFDAPDDTPDQHRIAEDRQQLDDLAHAIRALPHKCRTVFERCRVDGQSPRQLADELGMSLSTLEKRLARAVYLLTQALEPRRRDTYELSEPDAGHRRHAGSRNRIERRLWRIAKRRSSRGYGCAEGGSRMTRCGGLRRNDADVDAAEAAAWLAQYRLGTLDEDAFETWRDADIAHAVAFARALAMWDSVGDDAPRSVRASAAPPTATPAPAAAIGDCSRRTILQAACALAAIGVVAAGTTATRAYAWESATTAVGASRTIRLASGGVVVLNTDSRLSWRVSRTERTFWIERGEVALDLPNGPDAMLHGDGSAVILSAGRFNVRARGGALDLLVQNGQARVAGQTGATPGSAIDARGGATRLLISSDGAIVRPADADQVDRATAWQRREILFLDATLGSAVEEYNRFLARKIVIVDRELADIPIGGRFVTSDPTAFLDAVSTGLNIRVSRSPTAYLLTR